ncbi:MAG: hypothetical protein ABIJ56_09645 [Pseudomonadota bacterium]
MAIALLHDWPDAPSEPGLFTLVEGTSLPARWRLSPTACDPKGFPSPMARAEAMRHVLRGIGKEPGAGHEMAVQFRLLVFGAVLGFVELRPLDLRSAETDNLGRAILRSEPDARYINLLVLRADSGEICYGASHPDCLFWPHARRGREDWDRLARLVGPREQEARKVVAEMCGMLAAAEAWDTERVDWQMGLQWLAGAGAGPSEPVETRTNTRFAGPVIMRMKSPDPAKKVALRAMYIPVIDSGFAQRFIDCLSMSPPRQTTGGIEICDGAGTLLGRVAVPETGADVDPVALGAGKTELVQARTVQPPVTRRMWVDGKDGLLGFLRPIENAMAVSSFGGSIERGVAKKCPVFFPDPVRILVDRGLWRAEGEAEAATYSFMCKEAAFSAGGPGALPDPDTLAAAGGILVRYKGEAGMSLAAYADRVGEKWVGDLRTLGFILFRIFSRDMEAAPDRDAGCIRDAATGEPVLISTQERPLDPAADAYARVDDSDSAREEARATAGRAAEAVRSRLATLQQFVKTYSAGEQSCDIERLLAAAAQSLAAWALGGKKVLPAGRKGETLVRFRTAGGEEVVLAVSSFPRLAQSGGKEA